MVDSESPIAIIDETAPELPGGIVYVVAAAVILPQSNITELLRQTVMGSGRTRPFHWRKEGPTARERMIEAMAELGCVIHAHAVSPVGRKQQERARSQALIKIARSVIAEGVDSLLIESRKGGLDWRDGKTLTPFEAENLRWSFHPAHEPIMWIADAACGVLHDYFGGQDDMYMTKLETLGVKPEITYSHLES